MNKYILATILILIILGVAIFLGIYYGTDLIRTSDSSLVKEEIGLVDNSIGKEGMRLVDNSMGKDEVCIPIFNKDNIPDAKTAKEYQKFVKFLYDNNYINEKTYSENMTEEQYKQTIEDLINYDIDSCVSEEECNLNYSMILVFSNVFIKNFNLNKINKEIYSNKYSNIDTVIFYKYDDNNGMISIIDSKTTKICKQNIPNNPGFISVEVYTKNSSLECKDCLEV